MTSLPIRGIILDKPLGPAETRVGLGSCAISQLPTEVIGLGAGITLPAPTDTSTIPSGEGEVKLPIEDRPPVKTYSFAQLHNHKRNPESCIISEGLFKKGSMVVIGGPPKAYKSFIMLSLAVSLATGRNLFGAFRSPHGRPEKVFTIDKPRKVLLFEQEIGEDDLEDRIVPFFNSMLSHEQELFRENFFSHSLDRDLRFDTPAGGKRFEELIREISPEIAMFDPLIEFHDQEENSPTAMSGMLKNLTRLCQRTHVDPVISHHEGKGREDDQRNGGDRLRGASTLFGRADTFINLRVVNRNAMRIAVEFILRRGKPIKDLMLRMDPDSLEPRFMCWKGDKLWKKMVLPTDDELSLETETKSVQ